eukprot:TRINITY_DN24634_c0_g2_i3.p1 TRINITY_DN24634_c0_g2~~TRINITY_DN24634_c0_g2_i3.p1  ORF type:complete len:103 (-),score=12.37 TRINITY_DN24634_c0_g2_i3:37-345(-)
MGAPRRVEEVGAVVLVGREMEGVLNTFVGTRRLCSYKLPPPPPYVPVLPSPPPLPPYSALIPVSYTHLRAHETPEHLVCRLLLEKKKNNKVIKMITHPKMYI